MCFLSTQKRRPSSVSHEVLCRRETVLAKSLSHSEVPYMTHKENESSSIKSMRTAVFMAEIRGPRRHDLDQDPGFCVLMLSAYHVPELVEALENQFMGVGVERTRPVSFQPLMALRV